VESPFEFSGGAVCLDFVNTLGDRPRCRKETLNRPEDLLQWGREAGIVDARTTKGLKRRLKSSPGAAERFQQRAIALRERLYRLFSGRAGGRPAGAEDLEALNRDLAAALQFLRIDVDGDTFVWRWAESEDDLDRLLWPVLRSAADLLTSEEVIRVKECASETCGWLFVDRSRSHRRRWCDMKSCGNRAKARRHYRRKKKQKAE
jgi:predicted RNA-binding Zn ribbon-like protein